MRSWLLGMHAFTYPERLKLERREERRIRADILFVYKLLFGITALQADDFYSASALLAVQSAVIARGIPSVRPFFLLSVTFRYYVLKK